jgi:hypothetical protein
LTAHKYAFRIPLGFRQLPSQPTRAFLPGEHRPARWNETNVKYGALAVIAVLAAILAGCGDDDLFEHRASGDRDDSGYTMLKGVGRAADSDQPAKADRR